MIEIDDAGGGCFLGPEVLVIYRLETKTARYLLIPPQIVERVTFATGILRKAFRAMHIPKTETVRLCRGEIFDLFEAYLLHHGYKVFREKVSPETDGLAEEKFMGILQSYGFPPDIKLQDRNYREFYATVGCWYYSRPQYQSRRIRKTRLRSPAYPRYMAQRYPHLIRLLFEIPPASAVNQG